MNEMTELILEECFDFVFHQKINDMLLGKYDPPNMIGKAVDDISDTWSKLLQKAIELENE